MSAGKLRAAVRRARVPAGLEVPMSAVRPELFGEVAGQFERGEVPLNLAWMQARGVSYEEHAALTAQIALILRRYAALKPADRIAFVTQGLFCPQPQSQNQTDEKNHHA